VLKCMCLAFVRCSGLSWCGVCREVLSIILIIISYIILYITIIISYTILFSSDLLMLFFYPPIIPYNPLLYSFLFPSSDLSSPLPFSSHLLPFRWGIHLLSLLSFLIHSILVGTYIYLFIVYLISLPSFPSIPILPSQYPNI
jgi:hypothetical protein